MSSCCCSSAGVARGSGRLAGVPSPALDAGARLAAAPSSAATIAITMQDEQRSPGGCAAPADAHARCSHAEGRAAGWGRATALRSARGPCARPRSPSSSAGPCASGPMLRQAHTAAVQVGLTVPETGSRVLAGGRKAAHAAPAKIADAAWLRRQRKGRAQQDRFRAGRPAETRPAEASLGASPERRDGPRAVTRHGRADRQRLLAVHAREQQLGVARLLGADVQQRVVAVVAALLDAAAEAVARGSAGVAPRARRAARVGPSPCPRALPLPGAGVAQRQQLRAAVMRRAVARSSRASTLTAPRKRARRSSAGCS